MAPLFQILPGLFARDITAAGNLGTFTAHVSLKVSPTLGGVSSEFYQVGYCVGQFIFKGNFSANQSIACAYCTHVEEHDTAHQAKNIKLQESYVFPQ